MQSELRICVTGIGVTNGLMRRSKQHLRSTISDRAGASLRVFELAFALEAQQVCPQKENANRSFFGRNVKAASCI
jgi:hypothetical protein